MRPMILVGLAFVACSGGKDVTDTDETDTDADADADADSDADTDTPTGDTAVPGGDFALVVRGNFDDCLLKWDVSHAASSHTCATCKFALDYQFDVTYALSGETDVSGCPGTPLTYRDQFLLEAYKDIAGTTASLYESFPIWAFAVNVLDGQTLVQLGNLDKGEFDGNLYGLTFLDETTGVFRWWDTNELLEGYGVFDPSK